MLSVFDTLKETALLWARNFRYLTVLALAFLGPDLLLRQLHYNANAWHDSWGPFPALIISTIQLLFDVASIAALFGVLKKEPNESIWTSVRLSIKKYTWPSFRLIILIGLVLIPLAVINLAIAQLSDSTKVKSFLEADFYLIFILFAVAFPLLAIEDLGAIAALKRSWSMIRKHFLFIVGCGLLPFFVEWTIRSILGQPLDKTDEKITWAGVPIEVVEAFLGSAWGILFWCVCLRIKATEARSQIDTGITQSSSESPSAS